jgi:hypothetical protein
MPVTKACAQWKGGRQRETPTQPKEAKKLGWEPGIETNLYATATLEGELVWTGISDCFNPSSAKKAIDAVVKVVVKELKKEEIF